MGGKGRHWRHAVGVQPCDACSMRLHGEAGVDVRVWHVSLISTGTKGRIFKGMPAGVQAHTLAAVCCFAHPKVSLAYEPGGRVLLLSSRGSSACQARPEHSSGCSCLQHACMHVSRENSG